MISTILVFAICVIVVCPTTILPAITTSPHTYFEINRPKLSLRLMLATLSRVLYRITPSVIGSLLQCVYSTLDRSDEYISAKRIFLTLLSARILMIPSLPLGDSFKFRLLPTSDSVNQGKSIDRGIERELKTMVRRDVKQRKDMDLMKTIRSSSCIRYCVLLCKLTKEIWKFTTWASRISVSRDQFPKRVKFEGTPVVHIFFSVVDIYSPIIYSIHLSNPTYCRWSPHW